MYEFSREVNPDSRNVSAGRHAMMVDVLRTSDQIEINFYSYCSLFGSYSNNKKTSVFLHLLLLFITFFKLDAVHA